MLQEIKTHAQYWLAYNETICISVPLTFVSENIPVSQIVYLEIVKLFEHLI